MKKFVPAMAALASLVLGGCAIFSHREAVNITNYVPATIPVPEKNFAIGKFEISQREYEAVTGENPSKIKRAELPVDCVDWRAATRYCEQLTKLARTKNLIRQNQEFRLPTVEEWQFACLAGTPKILAYDEILAMAWSRENSGATPHPCGKKQPNAWGIHDMLGNVWEWCDAGEDFARQAICGGSFGSEYRRCSATEVVFAKPGRTRRDLGFRVVLTNVAE